MRLLRYNLIKFKSLKMIYAGTEFDFSSKKFHKLCDNKGPTFTVCRSSNNSVFGFYTTVSWQKDGGVVMMGGKCILFKYEDSSTIIKFEQKGPNAAVCHSEEYLIADRCSFDIADQAHINKPCCGVISTELYDIPEDRFNIDPATYLTGSEYFSLK
jgi:hypothetical protein